MADAKAKGKAQDPAIEKEEVPISEALQKELDEMTTTQRAAVITLLLGEQQAADIIRYLNPCLLYTSDAADE